ncbi:MAG: serine/threonine-protein kinase, partial [Ktedonobacteraceae bacterium]
MASDFSPHLVGEKDQKFGKYTLKECLGNGGEAEVWKAIDTATQETVAIRILRKLKDTEDIQRHFEAEVQKLQLLARHDHIIALWDSGWEHGLPYLVMPYIPDGSLARWLEDFNSKDQRIPFSEALIYIKQTIDALVYVHAHNIIHRDVKPSNLLRGEHGILLNDWGIALNAEAPDPLTRANIGSPPYRPPEQEQGHPVPASDQYAMAVTSCELITGKRPKSGGHDILQTLHPQIAKVLSRAWDPDPTKRFHSMQDFSGALNNA